MPARRIPTTDTPAQARPVSYRGYGFRRGYFGFRYAG